MSIEIKTSSARDLRAERWFTLPSMTPTPEKSRPWPKWTRTEWERPAGTLRTWWCKFPKSYLNRACLSDPGPGWEFQALRWTSRRWPAWVFAALAAALLVALWFWLTWTGRFAPQ